VAGVLTAFIGLSNRIKGDLQQAGADLRASLVDGNPVWLGEC
jgi:hypothetical protein